jgi:hypothetical protein
MSVSAAFLCSVTRRQNKNTSGNEVQTNKETTDSGQIRKIGLLAAPKHLKALLV